MKNLIKQLQNRGLIAQITEKALVNKLLKKPIALYCGFDPTKDSLHLGHLIPLLCLKRFQLAGHTPIALIGGATGLIGDPSFKNSNRNLNNSNKINFYVEKIKNQISRFINLNCGNNSAIIVNNYEWFSKMNILTFLNKIGNNFSVNKMIKKDAIKNRFNSINQGISFKEFSYHIMQSYDYAFLNQKYNVLLQIGGSDQWGNITSGIDLIRRMYKVTAFGLTMPLLKKKDGIKFGKTENNTLWLDPMKTSPYKFYQFWINTTDNDVYKFLNFFTLIDSIKIDNIKNIYKTNIKKNQAQILLAEKITRIVHGKIGLISAKRITSSMFHENLNKLTEKDFDQLAQDGIPKIKIYTKINLQKALVKSKLAPSLNQARHMIINNAITINYKKENNPNYFFNNSDILYNHYTLLRRGKKQHCLICWK